MARFVTESHMRHHPSAIESDAQQNHVIMIISDQQIIFVFL